MNFLTHAYRYLDEPYFAAGTAIPDWLNVVDRKVRVRSKGARPLVDHADERVAQTARGIIRHHHDDDWFHQTASFAKLSLEFSKQIRERLHPDDGFRPSFLGHILVEILLDDVIARQNPSLLDQYYATISAVDPQLIQMVVNEVSVRSTEDLHRLIPKFCSVRFLYDYASDEKLLFRLNNVMHRVKLPELPPTLMDFFPYARQQVGQHQHELLAEPKDASAS